MKHLLSFVFAIATLGLSAQSVEQGSTTISLGNQSAYYVQVAGASDKAAEKILKDYLKDQFDAKAKKNKKAKEWFVEKVQLRGVNKGAPVDLYIKVEGLKDMAAVYFVADRGDAFISADDTPDDHKPMAQIVQEYGYELSRYVINEEMEDAEKMLKGLEKDLSKLEKKNEGLHNDIKKAEQKIVEAKDDIEKNLADQESKRADIEAQIKAVEAVKTRYNEVGKN
jgi:hypothetical protein